MKPSNGAAVVADLLKRLDRHPWLQWSNPLVPAAFVIWVAWMLQDAFAFSASANDTLAALTHTALPAHGGPGRAIRGVARTVFKGDLLLVIGWYQFALGIVGGGLLVLASYGAGLRGRWLCFAPILAMVWVGHRDALAVFSAESVLGVATLAICVSAQQLERLPRVAGLVGGGALFVIIATHAVGLVAWPLLIVVLAVWPRPAGNPERQDIPVRPIWWGWLAAVLISLALVAVLFAGERLQLLWETVINGLRKPAATPLAGGLGDLPLLGGMVTVLAAVPLPVLAVATVSAGRLLGPDRRKGGSVLAAAIIAWLIVAMIATRPAPAPIAIVHIIAPMLSLLAVIELRAWMQRLEAISRNGVLASIALLIAFLVVTVVDDHGPRLEDPRNLVTRVGHLVTDPTADRPALITTADTALLRAHPEATVVLPAHRGGNTLAQLLAKLDLAPKKVSYDRAYASRMVLIHEPARDPIQRTWRGDKRPLDCTTNGSGCLYRLWPKKTP